MSAASERRRLKKAKLKAEAERHARNKRLKIYAALRQGQFDQSTHQYTVRYQGRELVLSELEYLWLYVRQELDTSLAPVLKPRVNEHPYLTFNPTT